MSAPEERRMKREERRMKRESVWPDMAAQRRGVQPVFSWEGPPF